MSNNSNTWEKLNSTERCHIKYPAEEVVRFIKKNFDKDAVILDDGCGAGRHVKFLLEEGYQDIYAIDVSKSGVEYTKSIVKPILVNKYMSDVKDYSEELCEKIADNYMNDHIKQSSCDILPFIDNAFDCVISYGVLYYLPKEKISTAIKEIHRVLKPGGRAMLHVRATQDFRYTGAAESNEYTDEGPERSEGGMRIHFFTKRELKDLCKIFKRTEINTEIISHNNDGYADVNFIVFLNKA